MIGASSRRRGFTIIEGIIALGLVAIMSLGFVSIVGRGDMAQKRELVLNSGFDLETRARAATQSAAAMRFTNQATPALANCTVNNCADNTPIRIEIRDAANRIVLPLAAGAPIQIQDELVAGNVVACTAAGRPDCQWDVYAEARPLCVSGATCVAPMFQIDMYINWHQQARGTPLAGRHVQVVVPREWLIAPPNFADGLCPAGVYFGGFDVNGAKICANPIGPGITGDVGNQGPPGGCPGLPCAAPAPTCPATCSCP